MTAGDGPGRASADGGTGSSPRVSVLLSVYQGLPHVRETVDSILAQTLEDWELVAVDDGSNDGSGDYLDSLDDPRIRVIHQENAGHEA